jgi:NAD(P)H-dependent FMN reductase
MKIFMFAASLRKESYNKQLINLAVKMLKKLGHEIDLASLDEFDLPLYNADIQNSSGFPKSVQHFIDRMQGADGMIISSPEYNYSIPGVLKNLIDWVSRIKPMPFQKQRIQLLSASMSLVGGNRGLWVTRMSLEACGALIVPDMFSLATAQEAFDEEGNLKNPQMLQMLTTMLNDYVGVVEKLKK